MNERYASQEFEPKWQQRWDESGINQTRELTGAANEERPKWYFLTMLPYPSGDLHIGHWYAMAPSDAAARFKRICLLYTSPSPRDRTRSRMPSSA